MSKIKPYRAQMLARYSWVVVGFVIVAITKYLTSIKLRSLAEKMQREEKESALMSDADTLQAKRTAG